MNMDNRVSLDGAMFSAMRAELDGAIREVIRIMDTRSIGSGRINLAISIQSLRYGRPDERAESGMRDVQIPEIKYALTMDVHSKARARGVISGSDNELIRGENGDYYIISRKEAEGQTSMFEENEA